MTSRPPSDPGSSWRVGVRADGGDGQDAHVLAQTILGGGAYGDSRILSHASLDAMLGDENVAFPGNAHGLGFELDQRRYMDDPGVLTGAS